MDVKGPQRFGRNLSERFGELLSRGGIKVPGVERYPGEADDLGMEALEHLPERLQTAPGGDALVGVVLDQHQGFHAERVPVGDDQGMHRRDDIGMGVLPVTGVDLDDLRGDAEIVLDIEEHLREGAHPVRVVPPQRRRHLPAVLVLSGDGRFGVHDIAEGPREVSVLFVQVLDGGPGEHGADLLSGPLHLGPVLDEVGGNLDVRAPERSGEAPSFEEPASTGHFRDVWVDVVRTWHGDQATP